jgi:hypothetical protein
MSEQLQRYFAAGTGLALTGIWATSGVLAALVSAIVAAAAYGGTVFAQRRSLGQLLWSALLSPTTSVARDRRPGGQQNRSSAAWRREPLPEPGAPALEDSFQDAVSLPSAVSQYGW